ASLNRPGGNATGMTLSTSVLTAKRLELVRELVPAGAVIAVLLNPTSASIESYTKDVQAAARTLGQPIDILYAAGGKDDFETAFATVVRRREAALVVGADPLNAPACSAPLRRASFASSRLRTVILHRFDRSRPICTWRVLVQTLHRLPWSSETGPAHRRLRDRSARPLDRPRESSSDAGTPHRRGPPPARGPAGCRAARERPAGQ